MRDHLHYWQSHIQKGRDQINQTNSVYHFIHSIPDALLRNSIAITGSDTESQSQSQSLPFIIFIYVLLFLFF